MGATARQTFIHVVVPATVPHIVTGVRLALGNAFMTVVAAELVAAQSGVGHLIWNSRLFAQTDFVFVGIITLGLMGFAANWALRLITARVAYRYSIKS
jgi:NitT/TauT family transport system permease protein